LVYLAPKTLLLVGSFEVLALKLIMEIGIGCTLPDIKGIEEQSSICGEKNK
jgi:hypothetical protein